MTSILPLDWTAPAVTMSSEVPLALRSVLTRPSMPKDVSRASAESKRRGSSDSIATCDAARPTALAERSDREPPGRVQFLMFDPLRCRPSELNQCRDRCGNYNVRVDV